MYCIISYYTTLYDITLYYIILYYIILYIYYIIYIYYCIYYTCILYIIYFKFYIICIYIYYIILVLYYVLCILYSLYIISCYILYYVIYSFVYICTPLPPIPPRCDQSMLWYCLERLLLFRMTLNLHVFAFSLKESATYLERRKHMIHMMLEKYLYHTKHSSNWRSILQRKYHVFQTTSSFWRKCIFILKKDIWSSTWHDIFFNKHFHSKGAAFLKQKQHSFSISSMSLKKVTFL